MARSETSVSELMRRARASLRGRWTAAVGGVLLYAVGVFIGHLPAERVGVFLSMVLGLTGLLITPPLAYG